MLRIVGMLAVAGVTRQRSSWHAMLECELEDQLAGFRGLAVRYHQDMNVMQLKSKTQ